MNYFQIVAAVIERNHKILCVQRGPSKYPYVSEKWEFPGGKIEVNETEEEAIKREIWEELSMQINVNEKLWIVDHTYPDFKITMHTYHCTSVDEPILHEHIGYQWLDITELDTLDWAEADLPIVKSLKANEWKKGFTKK